MVVVKLPMMTLEQQRRQDLQVQWLISALRRIAEHRPCSIDLESLGIPNKRRPAIVDPDAD